MHNNIRALRKAQRVSSDKLAARIGTSGATIRRLEAGGRQLTQIWMVKIADGLRCDPTDLIGDREATPVNGVEAIEAKSFVFSDDVTQRLKRLTERTRLESDSSVVGLALVVLEDLVDAIAKGERITIQ